MGRKVHRTAVDEPVDLVHVDMLDIVARRPQARWIGEVAVTAKQAVPGQRAVVAGDALPRDFLLQVGAGEPSREDALEAVRQMIV